MSDAEKKTEIGQLCVAMQMDASQFLAATDEVIKAIGDLSAALDLLNQRGEIRVTISGLPDDETA